MRDEELIRDPAIRAAVEARRTAASMPVQTRARHWPIGWLVIAVAIGVLVIVVISLTHSGG